MKKKYLFTILIVLIFIICSVLLIFYFEKRDTSNHLYNRDSLNIISTYKEYVIASSKDDNNIYQYAIFKESEYNNYNKLFILKDLNETLENRLICWYDKKLYFFGNNPVAYNIETGDIEKTTTLNLLLNNIPGRIDKILGVYNDLIYYEFSHNADNFIGKVDVELTKMSIINKDELPTELKK